MELLNAFSTGDLLSLAVIAVILFAALLVLRTMFKLTATLFRLGCFAILFIVAAAALLIYL
jgi:hypothetical protein